MPVADTKRVQTLVNRAASEMVEIRAAVARIEALRTAFQAASPDVAGTPLQGRTGALGTALTALRSEVDRQVWTDLIAAQVPSHRGEAL